MRTPRLTGTAALRVPLLPAAVLLAVLAAGCGTRVKTGEPAAVASVQSAAPAAAGTNSATGADGLAGVTGTTSPAAAAGTPGGSAASDRALATTGGRTTTKEGTTDGAARTRGPAPGSAPTGPVSVTPGRESPGPAPPSAAPGGSAACPPGDPIVVGSVGTQSGIVGGALVDGVRAVQAWSQWVNGRGGVRSTERCHPVRVIVADDGADPARHRAAIQDLVERRGVVAFVHNTAPVSGQSSTAYLEQRRVPVIGEDGGAQWYYQSPMFFPQATAADPLLYSGLQVPAIVAVPAGLTRLGSVTCQEAQYCTNADREWSGSTAREVGFQPVYRSRASLAQPSYTAECLSALNSNVKVLAVVLDGNGVERLARGCAMQGFRPTYTFAAGSVADRMKDNPDLDGALITLQVAPWFATELPAIAEYHAAMKAAGLTPNASSIIGWTSGKLFEAAVRHLPSAPTSAAVLEGLWSIGGDTLGGLTHPLTFHRDATAPPVSCGFLIKIESRRFTAPLGTRIICRP